MHIIIDGYNVIGILHKDMEKARDEFIGLLMGYKKSGHHDITVIFDGYKSGAGVEQTIVRGGIKVIYSRLGERADDVIKRVVSSEKKEWIVVSDDRAIINHAWASNSIPIPSERFYEIASREAKQTNQNLSMESADEFLDKAEEDEFGNAPSQKGNPLKLSKKQRAVRRVMGKL
ncbi:MAG: NYN domain-containing protein [Thermodesulfovibrionales bacterium]|nr:NYN domain-containing protein [Thermodesulfovibrionales bacterium]